MSKEQAASTSVGIWIDHREAVLVFLTGETHEVVRISSNAENHPARTADSPPSSHEIHMARDDDSRQRRFTGQLTHFYDEVIARAATAGALLIYGPAEAKGELVKRLEKSGPEKRVVDTKTTSRMSEGQMVKLVRAHFERHVEAGPETAFARAHQS